MEAQAEARREQERQRDKRRQDARAQLIAEAENLRQANDTAPRRDDPARTRASRPRLCRLARGPR